MNVTKSLDDADKRIFGNIEVVLKSFASLLEEQTVHLSPQLSRRLTQLLTSFANPSNVYEIFNRISSLFQRLLLELIQAQFSTKQREQDLIRLVENKGCSIKYPELTDRVIELLIRLYKAAVQYSDTSLERRNLIKYIMKELGPNYKQRQVERVIQTIYRCSCFHVTQRDGHPSRLKLKENLCDASELRHQLDVELINMAKAESIRLCPESWAYLLHGRSTPENISRMQSILDKQTTSIEVGELEVAIQKSGDRLCLFPFMNDLHYVQNLIIELGLSLSMKPPDPPAMGSVGHDIQNEHCDNLQKAVEIMEKLLDLKYLFVVRQHRSRLTNIPT
uniref:RING-type E3 ubiquitin transferase n=1 Tax=Aceria tosichella TaxID=561515 RepID=A0A6G1SMS4_9ACAR